MKGTSPQQHAREGIHHLEQAVLGVLATARHPLGPAEISRRADIYRSLDSWHDSICYGILKKLESEGRVRQPIKRGGWELTD